MKQHIWNNGKLENIESIEVRYFVPSHVTICTIPQGMPDKRLLSSYVETLDECPEAALMLRYATREGPGRKGA